MTEVEQGGTNDRGISAAELDDISALLGHINSIENLMVEVVVKDFDDAPLGTIRFDGDFYNFHAGDNNGEK